MMETKFFELRDAGTFIPVLCVQLDSHGEAERYLLARAGFGGSSKHHKGYIVMMGIDGGKGGATSDPYEWEGNRTRMACHQYIIGHWDELESGAVVDYEFITGATEKPKTPERLESYR